MGKFIYALLMVFVIELSLFVFGGTSYGQTSLFSLLYDPTTFSSATFFSQFTTVLTAFGTAAIIVGFLFSANIYGIYAVVAGSILTFSSVIIHFYSFILGQLTDSVGTSGQMALIISSIICGPLLLYLMVATVEWVRGNT